ncbi:competence protein ComK [Lentibacillus sp. Marseille-P4043]|uniref:competence protein ComK n=1 Tax=Lentibacillus sp. Marseille-P4043 TaxID=2040293 RepID=UPI001F3B7680|nr:competence protein ComK [Lentibacillus sp. Marseille-P4043]
MNNYYDEPAYEITPLTMAILVQKGEAGKVSTCILEEQEEIFAEQSPTKIVDYACKFFGASLKGRQDGTRDICGITHKAPIAIDPASGMYFFPTTSPSSPKCSWIAHSHIDQVNKASNQHTELLFKTGKKVILDISYGSVLNQVQRTAQFRYLLDNRFRYLRKHAVDIVAEPYA